MSNDDESSKLLEQYQKILKICLDHLKQCPAFEKKILKEMKFDNE